MNRAFSTPCNALGLTPFNCSFNCSNRSKSFHYHEVSTFCFQAEYQEERTSIEMFSLSDSLTLTLSVRGSSPIYTFGVNPSNTIMLLQRTPSYVELVELPTAEVVSQESQLLELHCIECLDRSQIIRNAYFAGKHTVLLITPLQVEVYSVTTMPLVAFFVKAYSITSSWDLFSPFTPILLLGKEDMSIKCLFIRHGKTQVTTLTFFPKLNNVGEINFRNTWLVMLYDKLYFLVVGNSPNYADLYEVCKLHGGELSRHFALKLENSCVNYTFTVVDNVLVLHDYVHIKVKHRLTN